MPIKVDSTKINFDSSDIFLIHGFGVGATFWKFLKAQDHYIGFKKFTKEINSKKAYLYKWKLDRYYGFFASINPFTTLKHYKTEYKIATSQSNLKNLNKELTKVNPRSIITHSMGAKMLLKYYENFKPNKDLEEIHFLNADIDYNELIPFNLIKHKKDLKIIVRHCWWDQALFSSMLVNFSPRIGQVGWKHNYNSNSNLKIVNEFAALKTFKNPHTYLIEH